MNMENLLFEIDNNDYVKLPRSIKTALVDGYLRFEEYSVLVWLWINANPKNGKAHVSYAGLSKDFKEKYSKNHINRLMLNLKRKKWVWFPVQQGRRSSFHVNIASYPLSNGTFTDLERCRKQKSGRSEDDTDEHLVAEAPTEVDAVLQKLESEKSALVERFSFNSKSSFGRSSKNDNEKENKNNRSTRRPVRSFSPRTFEEERCLEIARYLEEADMSFMLSALKKYGLTRLEHAYEKLKQTPSGTIQNKGAYFNSLLSVAGVSG
ncbi:hypothetical protein A3D36_01300 [Candidatus Nomurabacteria bacterium RIFCSPHIGHO2_02_FULL_36_29]|uniref:Uncharacterized protein n=1 Tax=Candidatus Nomurabacteria bacterium RIFCSPLOWO2_01_FULL_36_16 TaxID=1801767 RepID=A0A1F6WXN7_9BACT|nr:MAG: hypothetical protein A3D36_01300 [Candidatus Nomurabacteria bacterium RIFCSPHIGHO2_02_FULL_36_29]OGI86630.1 MAG: hypothetical protein A3A91_02865 [Candidatus Nomurabacteria bacterium RIFCSPLOWO2_01_FULL_36_16]